MEFHPGERVRGLPSRTDWKGLGTVMSVHGDDVTIYEDAQRDHSIVSVKLTRSQITAIGGRRGDELMRRPTWHTEVLRTMRLTGER